MNTGFQARSRPQWQPILSGELRRAALAAVSEIATALGQPYEAPASAWSCAETSLLHGYLFRTLGTSESLVRSRQAWQEAAKRLSESGTVPPALHGGFTGIAWVTEHLGEELAVEDAPGFDANADIDAVLLDIVSRAPWTGHFDLISGLVGFGIYGLERGGGQGLACLDQLVAQLTERACWFDGGAAWWTEPHRFPPEERSTFPAGVYDLGMAHGLPGVIAFLSAVSVCGPRANEARQLTRAALTWLRGHAERERADGIFPGRFVPGRPPSPGRTAWCYGDPGVAAAMHIAGRALADSECVAEALSIARIAAARPADLCRVFDAGLCHGAAGLGHVFNRFFQATGESFFADVAVRWFERALAFRRPGQGVAGFRVYSSAARHQRYETERNRSFLEGAVGIALALLAASSSIVPAWDRLLCLSARPLDTGG